MKKQVKKNLALMLCVLFFAPSTTTAVTNAIDEKSISVNCDWRNKSTFEECLKNLHLHNQLESLEIHLRELGFVKAEQAPDEDFLYFLKSTNDLSGYKIAVLAWVTGESKVWKIEIR